MTVFACQDEADSFIKLASEPVDQTVAFEIELAARYPRRTLVAVASGTAAIHLSLLALGIGPGDEVMVPAVSLVMSVAPILHAGARPVFVDCAPLSIDFDWDDFDRKASPRTKAVLPVHLWGYCCDMDRLAKECAYRGFPILEDACQAFGSRWRGDPLGSFGAAGCLSFKDGKLLSCGEGGAVMTASTEMAEELKALRNHWVSADHPGGSFARVAYNYRLSEAQAALARARLRTVDALLGARRKYAEEVVALLEGLASPVSRDSRLSPNGYSPALVPHRQVSGLPELLARKGLPNSVGTFGLVPANRRRIFAASSSQGDCPNASELLQRVVAPILPPSIAQPLSPEDLAGRFQEALAQC